MRVGHNSQPAPTLGRRPRTVVSTRGTPTLTASMGCTTATIRISAARSAPSSLFRFLSLYLFIQLRAAELNFL